MLGSAELAGERGAAFAGWPRTWMAFGAFARSRRTNKPAFAGMTFRVAETPGFVFCDSERGDLESD